MIASFAISIILQLGFGMSTAKPEQFSLLMVVTVLGSTVIWLTVTFLTAPEKDDILIKFYNRVKPAGTLWEKIYEPYGLNRSEDSLTVSLMDWIYGVLLIYSFLFAIGSILFGQLLVGFLLSIVSCCLGYLLWRDLRRL